MLIGQLVQQSGVSRDTIRYYEKLGLLRAAGRPSPHNTYKDYPPGAVRRLKLIQAGKRLGFTLAEIANGLDLWEQDDLPAAEIRARLEAKLAAVETQLRQFENLRQTLQRNLAALPDAPCSVGSSKWPATHPLGCSSPNV